ncbi:HAD hydrolase-like protein [Treponema sp.]|uniref:HAD hydrolase-like protein n=1 Tax=Treponema sp. TaxID=166 RepID=UPI00257BE4E7|nr:HAD hydrolase-like protein [Treponema sp.]MBE6355065.1 methyltransferase domain-containing protein [Treponema sp.]
MTEVYIFDFDGVIINSSADITDSINAALKHFTYWTLPDNEIIQFIDDNLKETLIKCLLRSTKNHYNTENTEKTQLIYEHFLKEYSARALNRTNLYAGIKELLKVLKAKNKKTVLLSLKTPELTAKILEHFEIKDRFDIIGYSKDFKAALNLINTKFSSSYSEENGIVLSDSPADIQKAKNEGYKTVAIRGGMGNRKLLVNSGADLCFSVASEIEKFINILSDPEQTSDLKNFAMKNEVPIMQDEGSDFICSYIKENNVKNILEIGSAIGYSSMKFAKLASDIHVTTIEIDEERYRTAVKNFEENNLTDRITIFHGDALTYPIEGKFDLIFIDAAKAQYIKFFERFKENLSEQGVIFSDNLSFHGMVEDLSLTHNYSTIKLVKKIRKYIDFLKNNTEFKTEFFKFGDGISISRRIKEN